MHELCELAKLLCCLNCKLSRRTEYDTLHTLNLRVNSLYHRYSECCSLSCSRLCLTKHVTSLKKCRNRLLLYRCHHLEAHLLNCAYYSLIDRCVLIPYRIDCALCILHPLCGVCHVFCFAVFH